LEKERYLARVLKGGGAKMCNTGRLGEGGEES